MSNPRARAAARRKCLAGFPSDVVFKTTTEVADYMSGSKIQCLECGKLYRQLGLHLKTIHNIEPDQYREAHGIPWSYGLSCQESYALHSEDAKRKFADGTLVAQTGPIERLIKAPRRKKCAAVLAEAVRNIPARPLSDRIRKQREARVPWGSEEHKAKIKAFPQVEIIKTFWKGKTQSPLHVHRRVEASLRTKYGDKK